MLPDNRSITSSVCPEFVSRRFIFVHLIRVVFKLETGKMQGNEVIRKICGSGVSAAGALARSESEARDKAAGGLQGFTVPNL